MDGHPRTPRLGLIVIGDEILAGHTQDANTHWLAQQLKSMGIQLARVEVCSDELSDVADTVHRFLHDLDVDYIVTSGGLGPTHDDRTMEGIAAAIDVPLELTDENRAWMAEHVAYGHRIGFFSVPEPNEGHLKMAYLPQGAEAMPNHIGTCLGAIVRANGRALFTLPGVPREFQRMFDESVAPALERGEVQHVEELVLYTEESRLYALLRDLEAEFDGVSLGSYPQRGHIILRATGPQEAAHALIERIRQAAAEYVDSSGRFQA